jgi:hypothetical protein
MEQDTYVLIEPVDVDSIGELVALANVFATRIEQDSLILVGPIQIVHVRRVSRHPLLVATVRRGPVPMHLEGGQPSYHRLLAGAGLVKSPVATDTGAGS